MIMSIILIYRKSDTFFKVFERLAFETFTEKSKIQRVIRLTDRLHGYVARDCDSGVRGSRRGARRALALWRRQERYRNRPEWNILRGHIIPYLFILLLMYIYIV